MMKTQVQIPNELYDIAKAIAKQREWSLAEVIRRGIEYMSIVYPLSKKSKKWSLPVLKSAAFQSDADGLDLSSLVENDEVREVPVSKSRAKRIKLKSNSIGRASKSKRNR